MTSIADTLIENPWINNGGYQGSGGMPAGKLIKHTVSKQAVKRHLDKLAMEKAESLHNAQYVKAVGGLLVFEKTEFGLKRVKNEKEITKALNKYANKEQDDIYLVLKDDPDNRAIDSILDRTFGKAKQHVEISNDAENTALKELLAHLLQSFLQAGNEDSRALRQVIVEQAKQLEGVSEVFGEGEFEQAKDWVEGELVE